jgi:hypothetical protein
LFVGLDDFRLQLGSPAIDAGAPLTTVHSSDTGGGTSLVVVDSRMFQDGWAGVEPDSIAVGSVESVAKIVSIDYSTNTITLATPISRSPGSPVWLVSNSSGTRVLFGGAPDIGAFEYGGATLPPAPTNLLVTQ